MGQSMRSVGGGKHSQKGADNQMKNQPEKEPGQKMADQGGGARKTKPEGGADHGARSVR
jgi:hypothetical protein